MNYINGNNVYGRRVIREPLPSSQEPMSSQAEINPEIVTDTEPVEVASCNTGCQNNSQSQVSQSCHIKPEPECNPKPNCDDDDGWDCGLANNCCNSSSCVYDQSKSKCVCTYSEVIVAEAVATGSTLFDVINTANGAGYNITSEFKAMDNCCNGCNITTASTFVIESAKVTLNAFNYTGTPTVSDILVNGLPVLSVTISCGTLLATIDKSVLDSSCNNCNSGTNVSILLNNFAPWSFIANYQLCGKVTTNNTTCKFKVSLVNQVTVPDTVTQPSAFVAPKLCIPATTDSTPINLAMRFNASSQLINPVLTAVLSDPEDPLSPVVLSLTGNQMLNTSADLEILKKAKICFNAMIYPLD